MYLLAVQSWEMRVSQLQKKCLVPVFGNRIAWTLNLLWKRLLNFAAQNVLLEKVELFEDSRYGLCSHFTLKCKLTDNFIDRLQNYYGIAVRINVGNLTAMQQNVIAALYHCASSDKKPMHGQCSIGKESWCYFQRGQMEQNVPQKYAGLSNDVLNKYKPVYLELCDKQILSKCLHGRTRNANECFNGIVWQEVLKEALFRSKQNLGRMMLLYTSSEGLKWVSESF
ncbi:putative kolobok1-1 nv [Trichonephila clavipes]|nr:putative kolobok1-1 nv [Trichonephila clavipes]